MTPAEAQAYALKHIFGVEGGDADDDADRGGRTRFGITAATARARDLDITKITSAQARNIYIQSYISPLRFLSLARYAPRAAIELVDAGVNCGVGTAAEWFQLALNALNHNHRYGFDLAVDGNIGPATVEMLKRYITHRGNDRGQKVLIAALEIQQGSRYLRLALSDSNQKAFFFGWVSNRILDESPS